MVKHPFILEAGEWVGEGHIRFSMMDEKDLPFTTSWTVASPNKEGKIAAVQNIYVSGLAETMCNRLLFYDVAAENFAIELQNQSLGMVVGQGIINPKLIGWEFRLEQLGFEGFEFYEAAEHDEGSYLFHAEYATSDDFRTVIHGQMRKNSPSQK